MFPSLDAILTQAKKKLQCGQAINMVPPHLATPPDLTDRWQAAAAAVRINNTEGRYLGREPVKGECFGEFLPRERLRRLMRVKDVGQPGHDTAWRVSTATTLMAMLLMIRDTDHSVAGNRAARLHERRGVAPNGCGSIVD